MMLRITTLAIALVATLLLGPTTTADEAVQVTISSDDTKPAAPAVNWAPRRPRLFQNYYAPSSPGGISAPLYTAPVQVPANVGHTYATYQPLMPHELLYHHNRTYYRYYDGGRGLTRTRVVWSSGRVAPPLLGWIW
jgi:hypothetical protein